MSKSTCNTCQLSILYFRSNQNNFQCENYFSDLYEIKNCKIIIENIVNIDLTNSDTSCDLCIKSNQCGIIQCNSENNALNKVLNLSTQDFTNSIKSEMISSDILDTNSFIKSTKSFFVKFREIIDNLSKIIEILPIYQTALNKSEKNKSHFQTLFAKLNTKNDVELKKKSYDSQLSNILNKEIKMLEILNENYKLKFNKCVETINENEIKEASFPIESINKNFLFSSLSIYESLKSTKNDITSLVKLTSRIINLINLNMNNNYQISQKIEKELEMKNIIDRFGKLNELNTLSSPITTNNSKKKSKIKIIDKDSTKEIKSSIFEIDSTPSVEKSLIKEMKNSLNKQMTNDKTSNSLEQVKQVLGEKTNTIVQQQDKPLNKVSDNLNDKNIKSEDSKSLFNNINDQTNDKNDKSVAKTTNLVNKVNLKNENDLNNDKNDKIVNSSKSSPFNKEELQDIINEDKSIMNKAGDLETHDEIQQKLSSSNSILNKENTSIHQPSLNFKDNKQDNNQINENINSNNLIKKASNEKLENINKPKDKNVEIDIDKVEIKKEENLNSPLVLLNGHQHEILPITNHEISNQPESLLSNNNFIIQDVKNTEVKSNSNINKVDDNKFEKLNNITVKLFNKLKRKINETKKNLSKEYQSMLTNKSHSEDQDNKLNNLEKTINEISKKLEEITS